jgi:hypothetical protein
VDPANLFCTRTTYWALRAEFIALAIASGTILVLHASDVDWVAAVLLFAYPDTIGYLPGAIAYRRKKDHRISLSYARTYDVLHSMFTAGLVGGLYALLHGPDWALLAIPMHLFGDRGFFGNIMKMTAVRFEPEEPHPAYARVKDDLTRPWWEFEEGAGEAEPASVSQTATPSEPVPAA